MQKNTEPDLTQHAKNRAKRLRLYLADLGHTISHSESLEATAQVEGYRDWNTYCAYFKLAENAAGLAVPTENTDTKTYPYQPGERIAGSYRGSKFIGTLLGLEKTISPGVWRAIIHFDAPVAVVGAEAVGHTRRRVRLMLNANGMSVNLKGRPDGFASVNMP